VDPDCGLKTRTVQEAVDQLASMQAAVNEVRKTL
jgi:methionine synthase II (cobalamin-independent)